MLERLASWVGGLINNAAIRFGPRLGAKPISFHDFGSGKPPWVQFEIENHGKTAAYELVLLRHKARRMLLLNCLAQHGHLGSAAAIATIKR
jgi:hypothetical protein